MEANDTKIHVGISVNKKKTPRIRVTNYRYNSKNANILSLELTIYKNRTQFCLVKYKPNSREITYTSIFSCLQNLADEYKIEKMEWPDNDDIFEMCDMHEFIKAGNTSLNGLHIYVTKQAKMIYDDGEKHEIMKKFHVDDSNGQHCGQKKLYAKLRDEFYWRYMTRDIAKFTRNCSVCMQSKEN